MARGGNFYYSGDTDIGAKVGQALGTALFGDPEARAKLLLQQSQMGAYQAQAAADNAHAGLYGAQTDGVGIQNDASRNLAAAIMAMAPQPQAAPAAPAGPVDPLAPLPTAPAATNGVNLEAFRTSLPAMIAAMAQMKGDQVNIPDTVGTLAAFMGGGADADTLARRAMIAGGHTPGPEFAVDSGRADQVAKTKSDAEYRQATDVATINNRDDIPVAQIQASTARRGQDIDSSDRRRGQDIESSDRIYGINVKEGADVPNIAGANVLARALGPNATITSNARSAQEQRDVYATQHPGKKPPMDSAHLDAQDGYPGFDVRPISGQRFEDAKARVAAQAAAQGGYLRFAQDEGTHWHFDVRGVKSTKGAGPKAAPQISAADSKMLKEEVKSQLTARGWNAEGKALGDITASAMKNYQAGGNPTEAVTDALDYISRHQHADAAPKKGGLGEAIAGMVGVNDKPKPKGVGQPPVDKLKKDALAAIGSGADPAKVKARFKQMTGQELTGA